MNNDIDIIHVKKTKTIKITLLYIILSNIFFGLISYPYFIIFLLVYMSNIIENLLTANEYDFFAELFNFPVLSFILFDLFLASLAIFILYSVIQKKFEDNFDFIWKKINKNYSFFTVLRLILMLIEIALFFWCAKPYDNWIINNYFKDSSGDLAYNLIHWVACFFMDCSFQ